jgi:hypothetical protein
MAARIVAVSEGKDIDTVRKLTEVFKVQEVDF